MSLFELACWYLAVAGMASILLLCYGWRKATKETRREHSRILRSQQNQPDRAR